MIVSLARLFISGFVLSCLAMHFLQPELSPVNDAVSYYMNGSQGWMLGAGLIALGAGSLLLARAAGSWLIAIWGIGAIVGGIFPPDPIGSWAKPPTFSGSMHAGAAMIAFVAFPFGAWRLSRMAGGQLRFVATLSIAMLAVFFACLSPVFGHKAPFVLGLVERVLLAVYIWWLLVLSARVPSKMGQY